MLISHQYKFIFLKTIKTAGTSIEIALSRHAGWNDIVTPLPDEDERVRSEFGGVGAQNHFYPWSEYGLKDFARRLIKNRRPGKYWEHMNAQDVRHHVGEQVWNEYYKFCFSRDPWDRAISLYYWLNRKPPFRSFDEFLDSRDLSAIKVRGWDLYTANDVPIVDDVFRYEELAQSLQSIARKVGIDTRLKLPGAKSAHRDRQGIKKADLTDTQRQRIAAVAQKEIAFKNYEF